MAQPDFEDFCQEKGLDGNTMQLLKTKGFTNTTSLCNMEYEYFENDPDIMELPTVQWHRLTKVVKELKDARSELFL